jgi:tetratricopeptide (TPR) repeat protein
LLYIARVRRSVTVRTPFVNASIEGTEFLVRVVPDRSVITVFEGAVRAANAEGALVVGPGQQAVAVNGRAPELQLVVRPRDAVQWALYYEPVLPTDPVEPRVSGAGPARDAGFYVRRASWLLSSGQLQEAQADLDEAQGLDGGSGDVYTLRTIVAVALNQPDHALENGRLAVKYAPQSVAAHLALSYALQARFDLSGARGVASEAVSIDPTDGMAWARLAELELALDDIERAAGAAKRAVSAAPESARAQTARGFTALAQLDLAEAEASFNLAGHIESDNPLARLGSGLVKIRRGRLDEGRADLERAVALNPGSSLLRSYLGKAYIEENRDRPRRRRAGARVARLARPNPLAILSHSQPGLESTGRGVGRSPTIDRTEQ